MPTLFLRLTSAAALDDEGRHLASEWLITEDDGSERASGRTDFRGLSDLIDPSADWLQDPANVVVLVPADRVLGLSCDIPGRSTGQIRRALPFVVEEFIATDIEAMHLAPAQIKKGETVRVNLVDRVVLEDWLACLEELELKPGFLIAEADLLPVEEGSATLLFDGDCVQIKTDSQAACIDRDNLPLAVSSLEVERLLLVNGDLNSAERDQLDESIEIAGTDGGTSSTLEYLAERWREAPETINLLQGPYQPAQAASTPSGRWLAVASLAAVWVLIAVVAMTSEGIWAGSQADSLQEQSEAVYRDIYPDEKRIVNLQRQLRQKLGQSGSGGDQSTGFTDYLGFLAQGIDRSATILSLNYTESRGELGADLLLQDYAEAEKMKQRLAQLGVTVEITSIEQQDTAVRARIRLRGVQGA